MPNNLVCLRNNFCQFKCNRVSKEEFHLLFYNDFTFTSTKARQSQILGSIINTNSITTPPLILPWRRSVSHPPVMHLRDYWEQALSLRRQGVFDLARHDL